MLSHCLSSPNVKHLCVMTKVRVITRMVQFDIIFYLSIYDLYRAFGLVWFGLVKLGFTALLYYICYIAPVSVH